MASNFRRTTSEVTGAVRLAENLRMLIRSRNLTDSVCLVSLPARRLWSDYLAGVDAIVYMVDAYDRDRFPEAKKELDVTQCSCTGSSQTLTRATVAGSPVWRTTGELSLFDSG